MIRTCVALAALAAGLLAWAWAGPTALVPALLAYVAWMFIRDALERRARRRRHTTGPWSTE